MAESEARLLQLLKDRSFTRGSFRLASGDESDYFIDGKMTEVYSEAVLLIGDILYERTKGLNIDAIGGLEVGAVPLTTAAVFSYALHGQKMEGFWVRVQSKDHGTRKLIEGNLKPGSRVVVVDDVFTKGNSAAKAVEEVRKTGCEVVAVLALVDRLQGAAELFKKLAVTNYQPIFTIRDFGVEADVRGTVEASSR
ncbi:MAG: orotate phosphoribosyltransferase [Gemmataceae bacterium]